MEIRNITYYKLNKDMIFNDDFELKQGTKVQFNYSEGHVFNVQYERHNEKRIFWVHNSDLTLYKTVKERWLKNKVEEHNIDLNEKWLEYEKKLQQLKDGHVGTESVTKSFIKRKRPAKTKTTAAVTGRAPNKKRVSGKKRTEGTNKSGKKRTVRKIGRV